MNKSLLLLLCLALFSGSAFAQLYTFEMAGPITCTPNPIPYNSIITVTVEVTSLAPADYYDFRCIIRDNMGIGTEVDKGCYQYINGQTFTLTFVSPTPLTLPEGTCTIAIFVSTNDCGNCFTVGNCEQYITATGSYPNPIYVDALAPPTGCDGWTSSPTTAHFTAAGGTNSITASPSSGLDCTFTVESGNGWITVPSVAFQPGYADYTVDENTSIARTGILFVYDQDLNLINTLTINQDGPSSSSCSGWGTSPAAANFAASGGSNLFDVSATSGSNCSFSFASADSWITATSGGGGEVDYTVDVNTGSARTGHINIKDKNNLPVTAFTVTQAGASSCTGWKATPASANFSASAGSDLFTVSITGGTGCSFSTTTNDSWITITPVGSGVVDYSVDANLGAARIGHIYINDQDNNQVGTFTIYQDKLNVSAVENINTVNSLSIYPNPGTGLFTISMKMMEAEKVTYKVYNAIGQLVYSENVNSVKGQYSKELNLDKNPSGVYFLKLETNNGTITRKLVISK